jgi:transcriptional regulator with XRE-family HTH domain
MARRPGDYTRSKYVADPVVWKCSMYPLEDELFDDARFEYFCDFLDIPEEQVIADFIKFNYTNNSLFSLRNLARFCDLDASRLSRWFKGESSIQYEDVRRLLSAANRFIADPEMRCKMLPSETELRDVMKHMYVHDFRYVNPSYIAWTNSWTEEKYVEWYRGEAKRGLTYAKMRRYLATILSDFVRLKQSYDLGNREDLQINA